MSGLYQHQRRALDLMDGRTAFALFMEQGTGKSRVILEDATRLYLRGEIAALLVVAPNGVHAAWEDEAKRWLTIPHAVHVWRGGTSKREQDALARLVTADGVLRILLMNIEATRTERGFAWAARLLRSAPSMFVVDESTRVKTPSAKQTKACWRLARLAAYRRIATGTPITQSPLDLWAQLRVLDDAPLGFRSFYAFRNRYAIMKERYIPGRKPFKEIVGYQRLEELKQRIAPLSYRITKSECLDLPDKIYERRYVELSPEQRRIYAAIADRVRVELRSGRITTAQVLTKLLRLQQVLGGFVHYDDGRTERISDLPRLRVLMEAVEDAPGKVIVWARFVDEIRLLVDTLRERYGHDAVVEYHGSTPHDARREVVRRFQEDSACRIFVGQPRCAGIGLTLTAADTVIYYSNDYSLETRLQSEDRAHRIGTRKSVVYIDLIARGTVDERVVDALRRKRDLAATLTGDELLEWI